MSVRKTLKRIVLILLLAVVYSISYAQPADDLPPDPGATTVKVTKVQDLHFGAFSVTGSGGSLTISNTGQRSASGGVTLLNMGIFFHHAIFDIEALSGTIISIMNGPNITLNGPNGGTVTLQLGPSSPPSPFTTTAEPPNKTPVNIGGTLTIGSTSTSPPGQYSGTFEVYINYQ